MQQLKSILDLTKFISGHINKSFDFTKGWPCHNCNGRGSYFDPDDPPCPIEGNKCRRIIKCFSCKTTGYNDESFDVWFNRFKEYLEFQKAVADKKEKDLAEAKKILKRISLKSLEFLKYYSGKYSTWPTDKIDFIVNLKKELDK
jgi:hypothetical protein